MMDNMPKLRHPRTEYWKSVVLRNIIAEAYGSCVIRTMGLGSVIDLDSQSLHTPIITFSDPDWFNLCDRDDSKVLASMQQKISNRTAGNLRFMKCILTAIAIPDNSWIGNTGVSHVWNDCKSLVRALRILMLHKYMLRYSARVQWVLPETIILIGNTKLPEAKQVANLLFTRKSHIPPILFFPSPNHPQIFPLLGNFVCWYCGMEADFFQFECQHAQSCSHTMKAAFEGALQHGENVRWSLIDGLRGSEEFGAVPINRRIKKNGPFVYQRPVSGHCSVYIVDGVLSCLFEGFNWTISGSREELQVTPTVKRSLVLQPNYWDPITFVATGHAMSFKFITADNVIRKGSIFCSLTDPFQPAVWLLAGLGIAVISSVSAASAFKTSFLQCWTSTVSNILVFSSAFIDQSPEFPTQKALYPKICVAVHKLLLLNWIITALVLSTYYKSIMKSNYVFEPKYSTNWSRLAEMTNFTFYFAYGDLGLTCTCREGEYLTWNRRTKGGWKKFWEKTCEKISKYHTPDSNFDDQCALFFEIEQLADTSVESKSKKETDCQERFKKNSFWSWSSHYEERNIECDVFYGSSDFEAVPQVGLDGYPKWIEKRKEILQNMKQGLRIICHDSLETAVISDLTQPRTVFVSPEKMFGNDMKVFKKAGKQVGVTFATNNAEAPETLFHRLDGYRFPGGLNKVHNKLAPSRMKALVHSGIYGLWEKWDSIRDEFIRSQNMTVEKDFVELSLYNSDIYVVFTLYGICIGVALFTFLLEFIPRLVSILIFNAFLLSFNVTGLKRSYFLA